MTRCNRRKRALVKPEGNTYARVGKCNQRRGLWWNPKEAPMPEPEVIIEDPESEFEQFIKLVAIKLKKKKKGGFIKKTQLTPERKCEEKPRAIPISQVKRGETWNYTHLRVRSVYLGLAKRRQRRKRRKQPKRSPARQWLQRYSRSGTKWWQ